MRTRASGLLASAIVTLSACSLNPRLAPTAVGCYGMSLDSFPAVFRTMLVPRPPELIQLDAAFGGVLYVPAAWYEAAGYRVRRAGLSQMRPATVILGQRLVSERLGGVLPPDSLLLTFSGPGPRLNALLGADTSGDWSGMAYVPYSTTTAELPFVPVHLRRQTCGQARMAVSGNEW